LWTYTCRDCKSHWPRCNGELWWVHCSIVARLRLI
jgi:hypothetical protein